MKLKDLFKKNKNIKNKTLLTPYEIRNIKNYNKRIEAIKQYWR